MDAAAATAASLMNNNNNNANVVVATTPSVTQEMVPTPPDRQQGGSVDVLNDSSSSTATTTSLTSPLATAASLMNNNNNNNADISNLLSPRQIDPDITGRHDVKCDHKFADPSLYELICVKETQFQTFCDGLNVTGVEALKENDAALTIFAPNDEGFARVGAIINRPDVVDYWFSSFGHGEFKNILQYHISDEYLPVI